jgi:hypothetical protein
MDEEITYQRHVIRPVHEPTMHEIMRAGEVREEPTSVPCPDWCELHAGHGSEYELPWEEELHRTHERYFGDEDGRARVEVLASEWAAGVDGPLVRSGGPWIYLPEERRLDGPGARAYAAALAEAADLLEEIVGVES